MTHLLLDGQFRLGVGIEDTFVPNVDVGRRALDEYELTQHYHHWQQDLSLVEQSGAKLLRYGLPWYRINPERGKFVWSWADRVVDQLASSDVEVVFDLVHYGTPLWLHNQFLNRNYPAAVAEYAFALAERYGDRISAWTPLNEPQWTARLCGESATWPPALSGPDGYLHVMTAICKGIITSQQAIAAATGDRSVFVHVEASFRYDKANGIDSAEADLLTERRFLATDLVTGSVTGGHPLVEYLSEYGVSDADLAWFGDNRVLPDILGMNYYPMWSTMEYSDGVDGVAGRERNDSAAGLEDVLRTAAGRYNVPVMLTETSFEGSIHGQIRWLEDSVATLRRLSTEIDVVGYVWWPFLDQVKWQYREGSGPVEDYLHRLGLVTLQPDDVGVLDRRINPVFDAFKRLNDHRAPARPAVQNFHAS